MPLHARYIYLDASSLLGMSAISVNDLPPLEQLLAQIPKLFQGNGNLATLVSLVPYGIFTTLLESPYGPAIVDILNSQDTMPLQYDGRLGSLFPIPKYAYTGTGVVKVVKMAHDLAGPKIPTYVLDLVMTSQYNIFGNFARRWIDLVPSAIFLVVNAILAAANFYVFIRGKLRNHNFYLTFGLGWQCVFNCLGFGMRVAWALDLINLRIAIGSTVCILLSIVVINFMNFILAHRILTFRHPETGDATWFSLLMMLVYLGFLGVLFMAMLTQLVIFSFFLDYTHWRQATGAMQASAILICLFSVGGVFIILAAYVIPRGSIPLHHSSRLRLTASNIESYGLFYFPPKHSQVIQYKGDPTQMLDSGDLAARTIKGTDLHTSAMLVIFTSVILTATAGMRCATIMVGDRWEKHPKAIYSQTIFYIGFGAFEVICNVLFLVFRIDLRFYIPDKAKKGFSGIIVEDFDLEAKGEWDKQHESKDTTDFVFINVLPTTSEATYGDLTKEKHSVEMRESEDTVREPPKTYTKQKAPTPSPIYMSPKTYAHEVIPGNPPSLAKAVRPVKSPLPPISLPVSPILPVVMEKVETNSSHRSYSAGSVEVLSMPSPHYSDYSYYSAKAY